MKNLNFKAVTLLFVSIFALASFGCSTQPPSQSSSVVTDKSALYISGDLYPQLKAQIPNFPVKGSAAQTADENELRAAQKSRSKEDCARAATEVEVTLQSFYGQPYGPLSAGQIETLMPFFASVREAGGPYIGQIKKGYTRVRPYEYIKGLTPCISKEHSFAYPSGHATLASLYSLVLIDLFPENKSVLEKRSEQIAQDRVLGGVHHPSDIKQGKNLGAMLHAEMVKSPSYLADVQKYQSLLKTK